MQLTKLSNDEVLASLTTLIGEGRRIVAKEIAHLVEVEVRRMHLELAHPSLYDFCTRRLGFSEGETFRRLTAARIVQRFPRVLDAIASGRVHLSSVVLLRDHFTQENVDELLDEAAGKSKHAVQELIARRAPKPDVPATIRKLPDRAPPEGASSLGLALTPPPPMKAAPWARVEPLSEARYKVELTIDSELRDMIEHARALMRHRNPSGDLANLVKGAFDALIEKLEKERLGKTKRPQRARAPSKPEHVTRPVRREVFVRDGEQCSFVSSDGERCPAREFLELDHRTPQALGGTGEAANVRILCRPHNRHAAEQIFGREHVEDKIRHHMRQRMLKSSARRGPSSVQGVPPTDVAQAEVRERVRGALLSMGFRSHEAHRAVLALDFASFDRPIEALLREALAVLT